MKRGNTARSTPDYYAQLAKNEGYPARSVYKLKEIQEKAGILGKGNSVLDLGAAPGSWSLYAAQKVGKEGRVHGIDLKSIALGRRNENLSFTVGDMYDDNAIAAAADGSGFNVILSDAAPDTTGNRIIDSSRSLALAERTLEIAEKHLFTGGHLAVKIFQGGDSRELEASMARIFSSVKRLKPKACRKESFEVYFVGMEKKA